MTPHGILCGGQFPGVLRRESGKLPRCQSVTKGIDLSDLVNDPMRREIEIINAVK